MIQHHRSKHHISRPEFSTCAQHMQKSWILNIIQPETGWMAAWIISSIARYPVKHLTGKSCSWLTGLTCAGWQQQHKHSEILFQIRAAANTTEDWLTALCCTTRHMWMLYDWLHRGRRRRRGGDTCMGKIIVSKSNNFCLKAVDCYWFLMAELLQMNMFMLNEHVYWLF